MSLEMKLWRVGDSKLVEVSSARLDQEQKLETWIANDPSILGLDDIVIVGRQVNTTFGGRIDLLALDQDANCVILELKKDRTPREVVAQVLEYAAWVNDLNYDQLDEIAQGFCKKNLGAVYQDHFGAAIPDVVNESHNLVVVASELDESSERIISYLSEVHNLSINAVFFNVFRTADGEYIGRAWLKDPVETVVRSESRKRAPWSGFWYVNAGDGEHRNWDDNRQYGYLGAGQGEKYSRPLTHLKAGDKVFAYLKGKGYAGYGEVVTPALPVKDFKVGENQTPLLNLPLKAPRAGENKDSTEMSDWAVGIRWLKTYPREEAKTFDGIFRNQNIVCKLRDPKTVNFLREQFGVS